MSNQPPFLPDMRESPVGGSRERESSAGSDKRRPRTAILHAAIICLDYAKQYLDKFTYWPDYILATHYHANVLALTGSEGNRRDAERSFKDVEFWLNPGDTGRQFGEDARKRIRAEAMYNRAVLLQRRGENGKAKGQFESVLKFIGPDRKLPPKGVRFATEFALLMLLGREFALVGGESKETSGPSNEPQQTSLEQVSKLKLIVVSFLDNCRRGLEILEGDIASGEREVRSLEYQLTEKQRETQASKKKGTRDPSAKQDSAIQTKLDKARARITKASKDSAIMRTMIDTAEKLEQALLSKGPPSGTAPRI
jgi:hypothetical protein